MINSLPYYIQNNVVYDIKRNKNKCGRGCGSNFGINCGYDTNYNYLFQSTNGLCNKPKFKFALSSTSYKL